LKAVYEVVVKVNDYEGADPVIDAVTYDDVIF